MVLLAVAAILLAIYLLDLLPFIIVAVVLAVMVVAVLGGIIVVLIAIPTYFMKKGAPEPGEYSLDDANPDDERENR